MYFKFLEQFDRIFLRFLKKVGFWGPAANCKPRTNIILLQRHLHNYVNGLSRLINFVTSFIQEVTLFQLYAL